MAVDNRHPRVLLTDLLFEKHLHSLPLLRCAGLNPAREVLEQLGDAQFFERHARADKRKGGRLGAKDCASAKWPDDFIVAHVNDPEVPLARGTVARYLADHVRVDCRDGHIHHLELFARMPGAQQHFENASKSVGWLWITHGRR